MANLELRWLMLFVPPVAVLVAMIGSIADWRFPSASGLVLSIGLVIAAITDLRQRKIFNWTTYPVIIWSLVFALMISVARNQGVHADWIGAFGLSDCLIGMFACGAVTFAAYLMSGGGAGDVKLAMLIGGLTGPELGLWTIAGGYILAAASGLIAAAFNGTAGILLQGFLSKVCFHIAPAFGSSAFGVIVKPVDDHHQNLLRKPVPLAGYFAVSAWMLIA